MYIFLLASITECLKFHAHHMAIVLMLTFSMLLWLNISPRKRTESNDSSCDSIVEKHVDFLVCVSIIVMDEADVQ